MRKARKEALLTAFQEVGQEARRTMAGRGADNFAVMLTQGRELFVRCFHRYSDGSLAERQRYVFAKDGCFRAGLADDGTWQIRREFREPVFHKSSYGYNYDDRYRLIGEDVWRESDMRYSMLDRYGGAAPLDYLHLYCRHPNIEYLMKQGYGGTIRDEAAWSCYCRSTIRVTLDPNIDCRSNDLLRMLGLTRTEFFALRGQEEHYDEYLLWRRQFPGTPPEELLLLARVFHSERGTAERFTAETGLRPARIARYLEAQGVTLRDYSDHLDLCRRLGYDMHDTALSLPHRFAVMHGRLAALAVYKESKAQREAFAAHLAEREALTFRDGALCVRQPRDLGEIVAEGRALCHCVGGYAKRHAEGRLHILFIRRIDAADEPFYTMELSTRGEIVQVRGSRNCAPTPEVAAFVAQYRGHIAPLFEKQQKEGETHERDHRI